MITKTTTVQEITVQAYLTGIYNYLFFGPANMSRDDIFNLFEKWAEEFEDLVKDREWYGEYYDEIDRFVSGKKEQLKIIFPNGPKYYRLVEHWQ